MTVLQTLKDNNFKFSKRYGQNFITDTNFLKSLVELAKVCEDDEILEIGTGAATLTKQLCLKCQKVVTYEIDNTLQETIKYNTCELSNLKVVFKDALSTNIDEIESDFTGNYKIVANIPYYITTPLLFKFLEQSSKVTSLTLMVQKEVAERIVATPDFNNYGALSVMIKFFGEAKILKIVSKKMFKPVPKVDSAFVQIVINKKYDVDDRLFSKFIKASFSNRRKTLINNLSMSFNLQKIVLEKIFLENNLLIQSRAENLSIEEFVLLCKALTEYIK